MILTTIISVQKESKMFANRKKSRLSSRRLSWLAPLCFLAGLWSILAFGFEIRPFQGDEVTGNNVLALWQFQPGAELVDSKGGPRWNSAAAAW